MIDHAGADGIEFDIPIAGKRVPRRFHQTRSESALPERSRSFMPPVEVRHVAPPKVTHRWNAPNGLLEVTVTFPPERVMSALAPVHEPSPTLQPDWQDDPTNENHRARNMPIMNADTGLKE